MKPQTITKIFVSVCFALLAISCDEETPYNYDFVYTNLADKLVLNEVYTYGNENDKTDLDYIELYNLTDQRLELSRIKVYESGGIEEAFVIPDGTFIEANGFWTLYCDKTMTDTRKAYYGLSKNDEQIFLVDSEGVQLDYVHTPNMVLGQVYARHSVDGTGEWTVVLAKTPQATNSTAEAYTGFVRTMPVYINEAFIIDRDELDKDGYDVPEWSTIDTDETADWIELYNDGEESIDLSGYYVHDDKSESEETGIKGGPFIFPQGSVIAAKGFLIVDFDKTNTDGTKATMGLGKGGDRVILCKYVVNDTVVARESTGAEKIVIDDLTVPAFYDAKQFKEAQLNKTDGKYYQASECEYRYSYGRVTDGNETLSKLKYFTKNATNSTAEAVVGATLTEVSK